MADPSTLLQALQSSYYKPSEMSAGIASQAIAGGIPALYNPYASSGSNFGVTLGAGLLSGLLGGYARSVAQEENAAMTPLIGQILQAPASERSGLASSNERLSPLVAALQFNDMERANKLQDAIQGKGIDLAYDPLIEQRKAQMMEPLELQKASKLKLQDAAAEQGIYTIGDQQLTAEEVGILDPIALAAKKQKELDRVKFETEDERRNQLAVKPIVKTPEEIAKDKDKAYERITQAPEYKTFTDVEQSFKTLVSLAGNDDKVSSIGMINSLARIWDPAARITDTDFKINVQAQSKLDEIIGDWRSWAKGTSPLSETTKQRMIKAAADKFNTFGEVYQSRKNSILGELPEDARNVPVPEYTPFMPVETKILSDGSQVRVQKQSDGSYIEVE